MLLPTNVSWDLYSVRYPRICFEMYHGVLPHGYGTLAHMHLVFQLSKECWKFHKKGVRTKGARWLQLHDDAPNHLPHFAKQNMILSYMGAHDDKWTADLEPLQPNEPTTSSSMLLPPTEAAAAANAAPEDSEKVSMPESDKNARKLAMKCGNYKQLAHQITQNAALHSIWVYMYRLIGPTKAIMCFGLE